MAREAANRSEELRLKGLALVRQNKLDEALGVYDQALALTDNDEARELITINKADAMIGLERGGPEVQELARVVMRRRNPRHVLLAAYALQYKHRLENDFKRALFYGRLALRTVEETNEPSWKRVLLLDLGNIYAMDSQLPRAIDCLEQALAISDDSADDQEKALTHGYALESLGYSKVLQGEIEPGIELIHQALEVLSDPLGLAEAYIDLCYGYLELDELDRARFYGEAGLEVATDPRHVRNAHYLLGEVAYKSGDTEKADFHFEELARFYPEFRNLKSLLFAIDLRGMVNFKL